MCFEHMPILPNGLFIAHICDTGGRPTNEMSTEFDWKNIDIVIIISHDNLITSICLTQQVTCAWYLMNSFGQDQSPL